MKGPLKRYAIQSFNNEKNPWECNAKTLNKVENTLKVHQPNGKMKKLKEVLANSLASHWLFIKFSFLEFFSFHNFCFLFCLLLLWKTPQLLHRWHHFLLEPYFYSFRTKFSCHLHWNYCFVLVKNDCTFWLKFSLSFEIICWFGFLYMSSKMLQMDIKFKFMLLEDTILIRQ